MVLAALMALSIELQDGAGQEPITAIDIRAACTSPPQAFSAFCGIDLVRITEAEWHLIAIPTPAQIRAAASDAKIFLELTNKNASDARAASLPSIASSAAWIVTDFVLDRARLEVSVWSVERFERLVCNDKSMEALVASTCRIIGGVGRTGAIPGIVTIRAAAIADMRSLPDKLIAQAIHSSQSNDVAQVARMALVLCNRVMGTSSPSDAIVLAAQQLETETSTLLPDDVYSRRVFAALQLLRAMGSLYDNGADYRSAWQALAVNVASGAYSWPALAGTENATIHIGLDLGLASQFGRLIQAGKNADTAYRTLAASIAVTLSRESRQLLIARTMVATANVIAEAIPSGASEQAGRVRLIIASVNRVVIAIGEQSYGEALVGLSDLLASIQAPVLGSRESRLLAVVVDLASASESRSIADALQRYASPPGSYRLKRYEPGSFVMINAYAGGAFAIEHAGSRSGSTFGPHLSLSLELGWRVCNGWSLSTGLQLVDLGALASWRLDNSHDSVKTPDVDLRSIFAPGIQVIVGTPSPVSIGVALSSSPGLRLVREAGDTIATRRNAARFAIFAAIDVPLFPIHTH